LLRRSRLVSRMQLSMSLISAHKIFAKSLPVSPQWSSHFIFAAMQKFYSSFSDTSVISWFFNLLCTMETMRWGLSESEKHAGNLPVNNPSKKNSLADTRNISFWVSPLCPNHLNISQKAFPQRNTRRPCSNPNLRFQNGRWQAPAIFYTWQERPNWNIAPSLLVLFPGSMVYIRWDTCSKNDSPV